MADAPNKITITICGDGGCEDSYSVTRTVDGVPYFLAITDTAGQEEYRGLWAASNLKSDAFLLVYDITNASSLSALDYFMEMIDIEAEQRGLEVGMPPPVKIIAGNKCDLKEGRAVGAKEGLEYARKHGCGFMETSAREMVNIEETFARILHPFSKYSWVGSNLLIVLVRRVVEARQQHYQKDRQAAHVPQTAGSLPAKRSAATDQNKGAALKSFNEGSHSRPFCCGIFSGMERRSQGQQQTDGNKGSVSSKSTAPRLWRRLSCW
ncbi:putative ras small monomeric GTPase [Aspergillus flavus]|uniref:Ras small monomeric GTPase n=1 Tax=Aspergillus flavus (strain ATCC 200026 / FGSC A1120 / IAM 13836 / NRRL 3357 / JCM 12722 / SRRC 167) TaxID=332952 RepID=A0A7U2N258_ASPFN|nr:putative ras small monomeric GTPase [Aspergillus flavus]